MAKLNDVKTINETLKERIEGYTIDQFKSDFRTDLYKEGVLLVYMKQTGSKYKKGDMIQGYNRFGILKDFVSLWDDNSEDVTNPEAWQESTDASVNVSDDKISEGIAFAKQKIACLIEGWENSEDYGEELFFAYQNYIAMYLMILEDKKQLANYAPSRADIDYATFAKLNTEYANFFGKRIFLLIRQYHQPKNW